VSAVPATIEEAAVHLRGGEVVAFTGAGISAESGIPTFRDPGGVWDRFDPEVFGTWEGLARMAMSRPDALADFLAELRRVFVTARPGPAHRALARLEEADLLRAVVTQNVDGLHREAGNSDVVEIHGSFTRTVCLLCGRRETASRQEFVDGLDRAVAGLRSAFVASLAALLPRCGACDGPVRPDFVAFGERLHDFDRAERLATSSRVLLVVATSGEVFPAASLPDTASRAGATVIDVSAGPTEVSADLRLVGQAGAVLPALVDAALGPSPVD
jgi:NAD-dependent deacetylase